MGKLGSMLFSVGLMQRGRAKAIMLGSIVTTVRSPDMPPLAFCSLDLATFSPPQLLSILNKLSINFTGSFAGELGGIRQLESHLKGKHIFCTQWIHIIL